ncbi:Uncharacterised protein [uncultured archaeon]|nr:Uncharacterised protein [uncultured archaeon]
MVEKPKMYFGHPISFYDVPIEAKLIEVIRSRFPDYEVVNPNQPFFQEGYQRWRNETGNGMNFYFKEVLPSMGAGTFLAFPEDLKLGAGVWGEAEFISSRNGPIFEVRLDFSINPLELDLSRKLTVEETRARIYEAGGRTIKKWTA